MPLTNFPNGATSFGVPWIAGVPLPFTGNYYWVQQPSGTTTQASPGGSGTLESPFTDINTALDACTANNNDVILFKGTIYIDEAIVWDKAQTHLIGVSNPLMRGKRSRISMASDATVFSPFISVTAAGCMFMNIGTFYGFADNSAQVLWSDTGGRNGYFGCEFMGFGADLAAAHTGSRDFVLSGDTGECTFDSCVFGVDTVARTAANYTLEITGGSPRNHFNNCVFESYLTGSGSNAAHILIGAGGIDRYARFMNCSFLASTSSGGSSAMTQAANVNAAPGGLLQMVNCWFTGVTNVETTASGDVYMAMTAPAASDSGLTVVNAPA